MKEIKTESNSNLTNQNALNTQAVIFTPRTFKIYITGGSSNISVGTINKVEFDYWSAPNKSGYTLLDLVHDYDDELILPKKVRFIQSGDWLACDDIFSLFGPWLNEEDEWTSIHIHDEDDNHVWSSILNRKELDKLSIPYHLDREFHFNDIKTGTYVFYCEAQEKGLFGSGDLYLEAPFDPKKLEFHYDIFDGNYFISKVVYDEVEINLPDNNSGSCGLDCSVFQQG